MSQLILKINKDGNCIECGFPAHEHPINPKRPEIPFNPWKFYEYQVHTIIQYGRPFNTTFDPYT